MLLKKIFAYLLKLRFFKPKKNEILFIGRHHIDLFQYYFEKKIEDLDLSKEISLYVLLRLLFKKKKTKNISTNYLINYIEIVNPKYIFTYADQYKQFYLLKKNFKNIIFISIQNGVRGTLDDLLDEKKQELSTDYLLSFDSSIGKKFSEYVSIKEIIPIGSFKNNFFKVKKKDSIKTITFISQVKLHTKSQYYDNKINLKWSDLFSAEKEVIPFISSYCKKKKLKLRIISRTNNISEYNFYEKLIENECEWDYIKKVKDYEIYDLIDESNYIAGVDSTAVYESLSRGKKIAVFSVRGTILKNMGFVDLNLNLNFGWPGAVGESGPFWTSFNREDEYERILNYITTVKDSEWIQSQYHKTLKLMDFDPGNLKFISLMNRLNVPLKLHE